MFNVTQLRAALASHLGQEITPEVAARIEAMATFDVDASHDPAQFEPMRVDGYVFQVERLRDIVDEIEPLHQAHFLETEKYRSGLKCRPHYANMVTNERMGNLLQFTVRKDGKLVGNCRMHLGVSDHTQLPIAWEDTLYLDPEHRGGERFLAVRFVRYVEACLKQVGATEITIDSKVANKAHVLMMRLGYPLVGYRFCKVFEDQSHVQ